MFGRSSFSLVPAALFLLTPASVAAVDAQQDTLPTLEQVLERYVEALGGRDAIEKLTTRVIRGRFVDDRPYAGPVDIISMQAYSKVPRKWLVVHERPEGFEREGFDGETVWWQDAEGVERRGESGLTKFAFIVDPQGALFIRDYFPGMVLKERKVLRTSAVQELFGRALTVYVVETDLKKAHFSLHFDVDSGLLVQVGYKTWLREYRTVDGVKVPYRVVLGRKGGANTWIFDEIEHNVLIDEAQFRVPTR
jgi:hypothetical protein